jgi:hypothetical protein
MQDTLARTGKTFPERVQPVIPDHVTRRLGTRFFCFSFFIYFFVSKHDGFGPFPEDHGAPPTRACIIIVFRAQQCTRVQ